MINLLPSAYKRELAQEKQIKIMVVIGVLIWLCLISLALLLAFVLINIQSRAAIEGELLKIVRKDFSSSPEREIEEKIYVYEEMVGSINKHGSERSVVEIFDTITHFLPSDMHLYTMAYNDESDQVSLSGFSTSRQSVMELRRMLEESYLNVVFPTSTWVQRSDIEFTVKFSIYE